MTKIKEFLLDRDSMNNQTVYMPVGAQLFTVTDSATGLFIVAAVDVAETHNQLRTFKICDSNGWFMEPVVKYVGSFITDGGMRHVVEIQEDTI